jgi:hypothetical protein
MPPTRAGAKSKAESTKSKPTVTTSAMKQQNNVENAPTQPQSPLWRTPPHPRTDADAEMTVEAYLKQECERTVQQVMAHAEARVAQFEFEAARVRAEMVATLNQTK